MTDINTTLHRAAEVEQAEEDAAIERLHAACDRAIFVIFALVLALVIADRYAHLLPGGGL